MSKYDKNKLKENSVIFRKDKFSHTKEISVQNKVFNEY